MTHRAPLPPVISHRGASAHAPENTLAALRAAAALNLPAVEIDVRVSRDGACVLIHDADLDRTTNGSGRVAAHTLAELRELDAGAWFGAGFAGEPMPTLAEALDLCAELGLGVNLDIKSLRGGEAAVAGAACAVLKDHGKHTPVAIVTSLRGRCLHVVRREMPEIAVGVVLRYGRFGRAMAEARELGCVAMHVLWWRLHGRLTRRIKAAGLYLGAFTVNEPARAATLRANGVDYLFSDVAEKLLPALAPGADSP